MKICRNVSDILTYYRTDSLHITTDCCAIAFIQVDLKQVLQGEIGSQGANCYYRWNGQSIYRLPNIPYRLYILYCKKSTYKLLAVLYISSDWARIMGHLVSIQDLTYWGFSENCLEPCCLKKYVDFKVSASEPINPSVSLLRPLLKCLFLDRNVSNSKNTDICICIMFF